MGDNNNEKPHARGDDFADEDMAAVGRAFMDAIADNGKHELLAHWHPAQCPSEIIPDLLNAYDEKGKVFCPSCGISEEGYASHGCDGIDGAPDSPPFKCGMTTTPPPAGDEREFEFLRTLIAHENGISTEKSIALAVCGHLARTILSAGFHRQQWRTDMENAPRDGVECHGLDTPERVRFYEHDFYVLSNFSAFRLHWKGQWFDTSEAVYHWEKFAGVSVHAQMIADSIRQATSAQEAFKIAENQKQFRVSNWDEIKFHVMRDILRAKADQHEYVRRKLLATGDRELVEDSWRDDVWGWGPKRDGKNMLGKLWMQVRDELRAAPAPTAQASAAGTEKEK